MVATEGAVDGAPAGQSVAFLARVSAAALAALLAGQLWLIFHRTWNADEFEHAHATWCVARGMLPYRDFFEHHTPWLYLLFAPLFRRFDAGRDTAAAVGLLIWMRIAMLAATIACVALTAALGRLWRDARTGWLAAFYVASSIQFLDTMIEFRPDVPALACWLASILCATRGWRSDRTAVAFAWFVGAGAALGGALLFTQKYVFALPGVAIMMTAYVFARPGNAPGLRIRLPIASAFAVA